MGESQDEISLFEVIKGITFRNGSDNLLELSIEREKESQALLEKLDASKEEYSIISVCTKGMKKESEEGALLEVKVPSPLRTLNRLRQHKLISKALYRTLFKEVLSYEFNKMSELLDKVRFDVVARELREIRMVFEAEAVKNTTQTNASFFKGLKSTEQEGTEEPAHSCENHLRPSINDCGSSD